ncbi:disaggregatase related repeat-containing protein [Methanosarcina sp. Mfa9]|uniref:disaggregatase related repeat-containing protein n=1 Tax=Methanosarcina sp. Mfa9 TaxID=3439063 RepID=UPI003F8516C3
MGSRIIEIPAVREANVQVSIVSGTVIVKDESGNVIDRSSNAADAIKAAIRAIDSGVISFQEGTYNIKSALRLKSNITFIGEEGVVFDCISSPGFTTGTGGYSSSTIPVASNANSGTTQIKLSGVSGLNVGNYLKISDDYTVPYEKKNVYKNGELAKIVAINGSTVTINKPLYDSYTTSRNAKVREISMLENIRFENIDFVGKGMGTSSTAIYFYATKNVTFSNCGIKDFGTRAISLFDCLDCTVENSTFKRIFRDGTGYGIAITNACDNIVIKNNSFLEKGRHYIAVVSSHGGRKTDDGFTRHVDVLNNIFRDCADEAVNSHPTSAPIFRVIGNEFYDSRKGVELARTDSIVKDNKFYRCGNALVTLSTGNHVIEGNYFNGNRISIIPHATSNIIRNNVFDNGGYISPELNVVIESNTFKNYSGYIIHAPDTRGTSELKNIEISNNICEDPLKVAMELKSASNVKLNNNNLRGYLKLTECDDVEIGCNRIDSPETSGVSVIKAKGPHTIKDNNIKARSVGIYLKAGTSRNNEKILIARNAVDAPELYSNDGYSNVTVIEGTPICPTPTPMRMQDSRLREGSPDIVFTDVIYLDLGGKEGIGGYRDLVVFDLSKYNNADQIEKATLSLFWYYPEGEKRPEDTVVEIYRPEAWNPDHVTWNSKDHNTSWANPGGDWHDLNNVPQGSTPYAKIAIKGSDVPDNRYHELDVTELVKAYVSGKYENTGFLIKASTERGNYIAFYSSDCKIGECAPKLDVKLNPAPVVHVLRKLKDSRLRQGSPDTVYKDVPYIDLGGAKEIVGYRDLLRFDLSELDNADLIEKAILSLFWYYPEGKERTEDTVVEIYRPETWNPNHVTWNNKDLNTRWENAGGDWYDLNNVPQGSTPYAKVAIKGSDVPDNSYHELDVTELVKAYVSGKYENTGFLIKAHTESGNYIAFCSSDYEDENKRPVLTVSEKA